MRIHYRPPPCPACQGVATLLRSASGPRISHPQPGSWQPPLQFVSPSSLPRLQSLKSQVIAQEVKINIEIVLLCRKSGPGPWSASVDMLSCSHTSHQSLHHAMGEMFTTTLYLKLRVRFCENTLLNAQKPGYPCITSPHIDQQNL